jgi:hypothetical protein
MINISFLDLKLGNCNNGGKSELTNITCQISKIKKIKYELCILTSHCKKVKYRKLHLHQMENWYPLH